tara:strand:+ start:20429 stop:20554 length:126 start_codon:yes stop_codon:yes gene_type:complete
MFSKQQGAVSGFILIPDFNKIQKNPPRRVVSLEVAAGFEPA